MTAVHHTKKEVNYSLVVVVSYHDIIIVDTDVVVSTALATTSYYYYYHYYYYYTTRGVQWCSDFSSTSKTLVITYTLCT